MHFIECCATAVPRLFASVPYIKAGFPPLYRWGALGRLCGPALFCIAALLSLALSAENAWASGGEYFLFHSVLSAELFDDGNSISFPQSFGSDTIDLGGHINVTNLGGVVTFESGAAITVNSTPQKPGSGGGVESPGGLPFNPGSGFANFGLVFQQANVPPDFGIAELLGYVDFRSLVATLQGSTPIAGGAFDTTGLTFGFSAGSLDYNLNDDSGEPFMHGQMSVANASGMISGAGNGSFILGTYSIPILADVPLITPFGNFDAVFSGQLEATSLPEPSAFILASLGGLAPLGLARSRLCRRRR